MQLSSNFHRAVVQLLSSCQTAVAQLSQSCYRGSLKLIEEHWVIQCYDCSYNFNLTTDTQTDRGTSELVELRLRS